MISRNRLAFLLLVPMPLLLASRYDALSVASRWALDFYKANISELQGQNICNFHPTCSQFSKQAIDRYGFVPGILMTADRLERCNPYAWDYCGSFYHGVTDGRMNDPVEAHLLFSSRKTGPAPTLHSPAIRLPQDSMLPNQLAFANYLFAQADYQRAIGEYQRFLFSDSSKSLQTYARFMLAEAFYQAGDYRQAERAFRDALSIQHYQLAWLGLARSLLAQNRLAAARHYASAITDSALGRQALVLQARSYAQQFDFAASARVLRTVSNDSLLALAAQLDGARLANRNRLIATLLSTAVPGLGQTYAGRAGDGFYTLLTVATAGITSWYYWQHHQQQDPNYLKFGLCAGLGIVFHLGNIYGANIAARDYNQLQQRRYLERIESLLRQSDSMPDYHRCCLGD